MKETFTVGELRRLVLESSNEFQAKLGPEVEIEDKRNNDKSYKESQKRAKDYNGGINVPSKAKYNKEDDYNRTTLDIETINDMDDDYKARVHAQAEGYSSVAEKNNKIEKSGEFSDSFYKGAKKKNEELSDEKVQVKHSGLQAREFPEETFRKNDIYESRKPTTLFFKKTRFLSEEHMRSRIPDEFKVEGKQFMMKDCTDNQYLIEWTDNKAVILEHVNKQGLNESLVRMKNLMGYNSMNALKNNTKAGGQSNDFISTLNNVRKLQA